MASRVLHSLILIAPALASCHKSNTTRANDPAHETAGNFDPKTALAALQEATDEARSCQRDDGPHGVFRIEVRYQSDGHIDYAEVKPHLPGAGRRPDDVGDVTSASAAAEQVQRCVETRFRQASIPPFRGTPITVRKTFFIPNADGTLPPELIHPPEDDRALPLGPQPTSSNGSGECTFNINTTPPSSLEFDGSSLGMAPKLNLKVPAGPHTVRCTATSGAVKSITLSCRAGETRTVNLRVE